MLPRWRRNQPAACTPRKAGEIRIGDQIVGAFGELHPVIKERYSFGQAAVLVAELDLEVLRGLQPSFQTAVVAQFPPVLDDIAMILDEDVPAARVEALIRESGGPSLVDVRLFDLYRGEQIGAGKKSLAYALTYQAADKTLKKLMFVDSDLKINKPELQINIDRQKAALMGVSIQEVARALQLSFSGQSYGYFLQNERQYEVIGQVERTNRNDISDLRSIYVRSSNGQMISLDNLVTINEGISPAAIYRYDQFTSATISAGLAQGVSLEEGIQEMERIKKEVLGETFKSTLAGQSRDYMESQGSLAFTLILALLLIYLILAAQFESLCDPLISMLTVPMAVAGALISLDWFNQSLNVFSQIGIITLVGLITKNGILIVEFANYPIKKPLLII